jgi:hypothetical protein
VKNDMIQYNEAINSKWFNLSKVLGDSALIYNSEDTSKILINYNSKEKINLITNTSNDTLFIGKVNKFKRMYLLYRELENKNLVIHALRIKDSTITGLATENYQNILLKEIVETERFKRNISDTAKGKIIIDPKKKDLKIIYSKILDSFPAMYFKDLEVVEYRKKKLLSTDTIKNNDGSPHQKGKIYPNPFQNKLTISSAPKNETIEIRNQDGTLIYSQQINQETVEIDCQNFAGGIYFVKIGLSISRLVKN